MEVIFQYVFGPVLSRRLGRSLGVDLVPFKTCTYDCIYCQLGKTTQHTLARDEYVPLEAVLTELQCKLDGHPRADYISLAGSGEPTLYSRLGEMIRRIKKMTGAPIVVITNGSLLWDAQVRKDLARADLVIPSLDAGDAASFARVNRPVQGITFKKMVNGLATFRRNFKGQIWLEVFLMKGASDDDVARIAEHVRRIAPDKVQINTVARPAPGAEVQPLSNDELERYVAAFGPDAEVIARYTPRAGAARCHAGPADMLAIIKRHPCTLDELIQALDMPVDEASKNVHLLIDSNAIERLAKNGADFFVAR